MRNATVQVVVVLIVALFATTAMADVPQMISYQGRLNDSGGDPVADGDYQITFSIYDVASGGTPLWTSGEQTVSVSGGLFTYYLGSNEPLPADFFGPGSEPFLGIKIGADSEMDPRTPLVSVPFAMHSLSADSADFAKDIANEAVTSAKIADGAIQLIDLGQNGATINQIIMWNGSSWILADGVVFADSADAITDGGVDFADIGQNGAASGQVMKWNGSAWAAANDETGSGGTPNGWVDDGDVVRLETADDSVGIGTATPSAKLHVAGTLKSGDKASLGPGCTNPGNYAFVAGSSNDALSNYSSVSGGAGNDASGNYSTIGGGQSNSTGGYYNSIAGGNENRTAGLGAAIPGGQKNRVSGDNSFTAGYADTVLSDFAYLFGINSDLNQDSTFMVDMPYIRFGDTLTGYQFPTEDGAAGEVMATDGSGQLNWTTVSGGGPDGDWTISGSDMYSSVSGNVGIGVIAPTEKLSVDNSTSGNSGYFGGDSVGVYGESPNDGDYGVYGKNTSSDNFGYLGGDATVFTARHPFLQIMRSTASTVVMATSAG